ncbi:hypothetical protein FHW58_001561 [Duganella sp. 1224]|uniref:hypothetical protein n=1 Tax=Duganella sp. 1224 TaxID=2587052 RepID=UPI0015C88A5A|nr:hypothetical protein [Duganella sp. 1224]NYE60409.1 hypothetical protein [Duganella sp. 1224]
MFTTVAAHLPTDTLLDLLEQLKRRGGTQDLSEAITTAVEFWLADQKQFPKTADPNGLRGYQWKCLFLPEGTVLRSWSYGDHNDACVKGNEIIHRGKSVSPNEFARAFARSNRNAWIDLKIRRPGDKHFKQASILRQEILREQEEARKAKAGAAGPGREPAPPNAGPSSTPAAALLSPAYAAASPIPPMPTTPQPLAAEPPQPPAPRDTKPREDWTLPERRKWRIRLEDIAFD